jgi:hypothetical protein
MIYQGLLAESTEGFTTIIAIRSPPSMVAEQLCSSNDYKQKTKHSNKDGR